jgi:hypothetical protein
MDLYQIIAAWTGWPFVVAVLLLAGGYGYWVMQTSQQTLQKQNDWLKQQLDNAKENTPDLLAQRLATRHRELSLELERLAADHEASQGLVHAKQTELDKVRYEITVLNTQLEKAKEVTQLISSAGLVCPKCGAPLVERTKYDEVIDVAVDGTVIFDEQHSMKYGCGLRLSDGKELAPCLNSLGTG